MLGSISIFTMSDNTRTHRLVAMRARNRFLADEFFEASIAPVKTAWWSQTGSNRRPPACKAGALPAELWPLQEGMTVDGGQRKQIFSAARRPHLSSELVGLDRLERSTSPLSGVRSNHLSYRPESLDAQG